MTPAMASPSTKPRAPISILGEGLGIAAAALLLIAAIGAVMVLLVTEAGIGTEPDSAYYLAAARSVLAGKGLTLPVAGSTVPAPMTNFAPLLPLVLAGMGRVGIDPLAGLRWLHAILFGAIVLMTGAMIARYSGSRAATIFGAFAIATTADLILNYGTLLSEPVFLFFVLAGLMLVAKYIERPSLTLLLSFSAAFGLAGAARYSGACLVPVGAGAIWFAGGPARRRWRHLGAYLLIFGTPAAVWLARNVQRSGNPWDRVLALHSLGVRRFTLPYSRLSGWLLPPSVPEVLRVAVLSALALLLLWPLFSRSANSRMRILYRVCLAFLVSYLLLFYVTQAFLDAQIWMVGRHLMAVYAAGLLLVVCAGVEMLHAMPLRWRVACTVLCIGYAGVAAGRVAKNVRKEYREGIGFSSRQLQRSDLVAAIKSLGLDVPLVTNARSALYLLTGRVAYAIPSRIDGKTGRIRMQYQAEIDRIRDQLENRGAVLVMFTGKARPEGSLDSDLEAELGLERCMVSEQGYLAVKGR
jgi:hypothetical protein